MIWKFNFTSVILFGNPTFDDTLKTVICLGKQFIYKMEQQEQSLVGFRNVV